MRVLRRTFVGAVVFVLLVGCASPESPTALAPDDVVGTYGLVSFSGIAADQASATVTGSLVLHELGLVERSISYQTADGSEVAQTLRGSYSLSGGSIQLTLLDGTYAWRPRATLDGPVLMITYPSPGDGPVIVERYARR